MGDSRRNDLEEHARNLIRYKSARLIGEFGFTRDDREDLIQDLALDLLIRLPKFDPAKASLRKFVTLVINRRIATLIRSRFQQKRDFRREVCSLDDDDSFIADGLTHDDLDSRTGRRSRPAAERADMQADLLRGLEELPPDLRSLADELLTKSITEIARELGVSRGTLYKTGIARLRKAFEDRGLREYL